MTSKSKFAITLASLTFIFILGLLAIFSVYLLKNTMNMNYLHSETMIMKKFVKNNKNKLVKKNDKSMDMK